MMKVEIQIMADPRNTILLANKFALCPEILNIEETPGRFNLILTLEFKDEAHKKNFIDEQLNDHKIREWKEF